MLDLQFSEPTDYSYIMNMRQQSLSELVNGPVLITGHTGFKGAWLTMLLQKIGIEVVGFSLPPLEDSLYSRLNMSGNIKECFGDIRDKAEVSSVMNKFNPIAIIHLAAQPLVLESYNSPTETFEVNCMGTANILQNGTLTKSVKSIIVVTTDKVYENNNLGIPFKENDPLRGKDPYSASKVAAEAAISAWQQIAINDLGPKIISVRAGNVIGGGDLAKDRLIPDLIRSHLNKTTVEIRNPKSTRPWQHVLDPLCGYIKVLNSSMSGEIDSAFNFGPSEKSLEVQKVIDIAQKAWPNTFQVSFQNSQEAKYEALSLELDSKRSNEKLGWTPAWSQNEAITETVTWWKNLIINDKSPIDLCNLDINKAIMHHGL
jgi:CDP-glucose 4,6-dehydratase